MRITRPTKAKDIKRNWYLVDVTGLILGRESTKIANILMGKSKPYYVSYLDCGDFVVVINAKNVKVTGKKETQKIYTQYSGYPGGLKKRTLRHLREIHPERIIRESVKGMLPNNKLRDVLLKRLYIFDDSNHPYKDKIVNV